ncbi:MAG TPA: PSD1 and planctomycete cytochrome C domain-containing protein [Bryobacterales bacterium]|nr:PSD1 and planctomycete cytochrome C domain-containing protein [Bryobacterales bacterium]
MVANFVRQWHWIAVPLALAAAPLAAQEKPSFSPQAVSFFESSVQPILKANCLPCHNKGNRTSGLAFDTREDVLKGGKRGPAVKPGAPGESRLMAAVEHKGELKMPFGREQLTDEQIAVLRQWIEQNVPWSAENGPKKPRGWDHWAFQVPKRPAVPPVQDSAWVRNPIDNFILARLEKEKVKPSPEADRYTLLRRVSLDLTGLPPTPKEMQDFLSDTSPHAYEKVVDRLLASPHYGERWGRHWLDLARYADSDGYSIDAPRPIWKYRDWVINALNRDEPFDQFVIEQIAGDLLPHPTTDQLIATGFHRNTPSNYEGGIDFEQYRVEAVADRVATTGAVFLGLTIGCARCHDHKYDPIKQSEFYQLFAFYNNTTEISKESDRYDFYRPYLDLPTPAETARANAYHAQLNVLSRELVDYIQKLEAKSRKPGDPPLYKDPGLQARVATLRTLLKPTGTAGAPEYHWRGPWVTKTLIMRELPAPRETYVQIGGDFLRPGARVYPGVPAVLSSQPVTGNRLDLAKWLVNPSNPLTARVTVNRMWQAYFGKGIVETENDFGLMGATPTHPELLDWLATEFVAKGWSQKAMHRLIVTSETYRQSSRNRPELEERDPYNHLLARQARFRLEAESIRDAALVASGLLTPTIGGSSVYPPIPEGSMSTTQVKRAWPTETGPNRYRRGLYTFFYRMAPPPSLALFDAPVADSTCTRRIRSNSPLQALTLLNDDTFVEFARALAKRTLKEAPANGERERLEYAFLLAMARPPRPKELNRLAAFLASERDEYRSDTSSAAALATPEAGAFDSGTAAAETGKQEADSVNPKEAPELAAWIQVCRVLFNLDDFMTRD